MDNSLINPSMDNSLINPLNNKLLHDDIINSKGDIIKNSQLRTNQMIPGILVIDGKTYGREKVKFGRLLYKCIPDSKHLPCFVIPYEDTRSQFNKNCLNKYVLFCFKEWKDKHPLGMITHVIGDVDVEEAFQMYQMYSKSIFHSITAFNKYTIERIREFEKQGDDIGNIILGYTEKNRRQSPLGEKAQPLDRRHLNIFSIDPENCKDIDDAMGICKTDTGYIISIYIANVTIWMEILGLWNVFSERISTIYLPTTQQSGNSKQSGNGSKRVSMLPTILSENYASLLEGQTRVAFCMDVYVPHDYSMIIKIEYKNAIVKLDKNYSYEDKDLLKHSDYMKILEITKSFVNVCNYLEEINDSHELVEFWMIMMNHQCGQLLSSHKTGIYRTTEPALAGTQASAKIPQFMLWNTTSASYCNYENNKGHAAVGIDTYTHITSPIRRIVDLLNITTIQQKLGLICLSDNCCAFIEKWNSNERLSYINENMRSIRKVQNDCMLLHILNGNDGDTPLSPSGSANASGSADSANASGSASGANGVSPSDASGSADSANASNADACAKGAYTCTKGAYTCTKGAYKEFKCYVWRQDLNYMNVYIPEIRHMTQIKATADTIKATADTIKATADTIKANSDTIKATADTNTVEEKRVKIYVMNDETTLKKKVRVMLV
jgi:exoribonuclease R